MPHWGQLLKELETTSPDPKSGLGPPGVLRRKYLRKLSEHTGRDTIIYYSGWMEGGPAPPDLLQLGLPDMEGFMEVCSNTGEKALDLIIHSPGGEADAVEQLAEYLRTQYDHIRAVVPIAAMSAATMLALSSDEILMGAHSQLGPIDPQMTIMTMEGPRTASAQAIRDQFDMAQKDGGDPALMNAWFPILRMIGPGLLAACDHAAKRAEQIVEKAMAQYMLRDVEDGSKKAKEAAEWFGAADKFLSHGRPVRSSEAREHHVIVKDLEDDDVTQDLVLSVHHATLLGMNGGVLAKLVESNRERRWLRQVVVAEVANEGPKQKSGKKKPPPPPRKKRRRG